MLLGKPDTKTNLYFGAATAAGLYAGEQLIAGMLGNSVDTLPNDLGGKDTSKLESPVLELSTGVGAVYVLDRFVLRNPGAFRQNLLPRLGVILAASFAGEYADDYWNTRALNYLGN